MVTFRTDRLKLTAYSLKTNHIIFILQTESLRSLISLGRNVLVWDIELDWNSKIDPLIRHGFDKKGVNLTLLTCVQSDHIIIAHACKKCIQKQKQKKRWTRDWPAPWRRRAGSLRRPWPSLRLDSGSSRPSLRQAQTPYPVTWSLNN